jgi:hypothetical protein
MSAYLLGLASGVLMAYLIVRLTDLAMERAP